jgi:hypothetical protein
MNGDTGIVMLLAIGALVGITIGIGALLGLIAG